MSEIFKGGATDCVTPISNKDIADSYEDLQQMWSAMCGLCESLPGAGAVLASRSELPPLIKAIFNQASRPLETTRSETGTLQRIAHVLNTAQVRWEGDTVLAYISALVTAGIANAPRSATATNDDHSRYQWLANRVLACDYGDNDKPGEIGWRIRHDLLRGPNGERQPAFMYGKSINEAIDNALAKEVK